MASDPSGRVCVWCGGTPVTAEHVWPRWIGKYLPKHKVPHLVLSEREGRETSIAFRGERPPFTTEVRCVCEPCNTGWMHELETAAEPILGPAIAGRAQTWHEWRQMVAATWALKTAIMVEQGVERDQRAIPQELYGGFRQWLRPPRMYTQIWAARYVGESEHFYGRSMMRFLLSTPEGVSVPNDLQAYGACLQVGALAFRLFGHLVQGGPTRVAEGEIARCLVPIWPVSPSVRWPPERGVDDGGMEMLVKSLADVPPEAPIRP